MSRNAHRDTIYAVNLSLLSTHQADAAFFREWDVFGVPGGLPFFLSFNVFAMTFLALGLIHVAQNGVQWRLVSLLCAATGTLTVAVHVVFLRVAPAAFSTKTSTLLFIAIASVSALQAKLALRNSS